MENVLVQHIVSTPDVVGGKPRIDGHRIRVMDIVTWHEKRGLSHDEILELYPGLTLADVHAALAYYFDHQDEIESDFEDEATFVYELRPQYASVLREKLGD